MSIPPLSKQFDPLTRHEILALRPGAWGDEDLLKVMKYFDQEKKDRAREMAVAELILRSPQMVDVDYALLYLNLIGYYRWIGDFPPALRWAHVLITFSEQHEDGLNRTNHVRDLAETYLNAGDLDTGLALFTRLLRASPGDIWNYNSLGLELPRAGLPGLASEVLDRALAITAKNDPEHLNKQLTDQRSEVGRMLAGTPDHSGEISPEILSDFRIALILPVHSRKENPTRSMKLCPTFHPSLDCLPWVRKATRLSTPRFWRKGRL